MKTIRHLLFAATVIILTAATCGPDINPDPVPDTETDDFYFDDGSTTKSFSFMEYERVIDVTLKQPDGTVSVEIPEADQSWIEFTKYSNARFRFHLLENKGNQERTTKLTFKMANATHDITLKITQVGSEMKGSLRHGLMELYKATNELGWTYQQNWGSDKPVYEWYGLSPVASLAEYNGVPVYCGNIDLWDIDLSFNNLKGVIPEDFWAICKAFRSIDLSYNTNYNKPQYERLPYLEGSVLPDNVWHDALVKVALAHSGIKIQLDSKLGNAMNLQELDLSYCNVTSQIPDVVTKLEKLKVLNLEGAGLLGTIPNNIGNLKKLEELNLAVNFDFGGTFPESIYEMTKLKKLDFAGTKISGTLSARVKNMESIELLYLGKSHMRGEIPEEIGMLKNLYGRNGNIGFAGAHFTNIPEFYRFVHSYNGDWDSWGHMCHNFQFAEGVYITPETMYEYYRDVPGCITLPMPKWYKERYGLRCWEVGYVYRSEENHNNPIYNPVYPVANDLQYPADEYYFDEKISAWTHPKYNGKAAKHYHVVNGEWTYDENFDWNDPADVEQPTDDDWVTVI